MTPYPALHCILCSALSEYGGAKLYCEISSSHGGEYDVQNCLMRCTVV
jgi:hypothetical protein